MSPGYRMYRHMTTDAKKSKPFADLYKIPGEWRSMHTDGAIPTTNGSGCPEEYTSTPPKHLREQKVGDLKASERHTL